ncbi:carboxymuconolactone decarboxylase family protein [Caenimonas aquaedulcis]|uniref:Carboxymuconolactone decarboxylase family protein n=1 Tax=Caenimonas aquaedulcis TaxID=2793270 RepID=A0A931H653_9BURK|nr:carboxymuconolactone decarboxylase family protein [Caenimonas aquaedulcis]MBG9389172.1 carboxymuconolactone decarboxylase family protein [Caenimonas aquaedulcis]
MPDDSNTASRQGSAQPWRERMPLPADSAMTPPQREAAQALIAGPRKGVYGPFLPLLRSPQLLDRVAKVGEYLRFESVLDARIREFATCIAARHVSNQFEWLMHAPLAVKAGVSAAAIEALRVGARPKGLPADEDAALDLAGELLTTHGASEPTYAAAVMHFGEQGVVELTTLVGYFVMVSWLMNVAHTPAQAGASGEGLPAFPL